MEDHSLLAHYHELIHKIDLFWDGHRHRFDEHILCRAGCADCCRDDRRVLPVEFYAIRSNANTVNVSLPSKNECGQGCVFLFENRCRIYPLRPVICRTHGLPLLIKTAEGERRDCCPKNFQDPGLGSLNHSDLLDLETLNTLLITVNLLFCRQAGIDSPDQKIPLARLLDQQ